MVKQVKCAEPPVDDPCRIKMHKFNSKTGEPVSITEDGRPVVFVNVWMISMAFICMMAGIVLLKRREIV